MSNITFHNEHAAALRARISGLPQRQSTFGCGSWHQDLFDTLEFLRTELKLAVSGEPLLLYMQLARDGDHVLVGELGSGGLMNFHWMNCYTLPYDWVGPAGRQLLCAHLAAVRSTPSIGPDWLCSSRGFWPSPSWRSILFTEPTSCDVKRPCQPAVATARNESRKQA